MGHNNLRLSQRDFYVEIILWRQLNMAELDVGKHCEIKSCKQKGTLFINVIQPLKKSSKLKVILFPRSLFIQIATVNMVLT